MAPTAQLFRSNWQLIRVRNCSRCQRWPVGESWLEPCWPCEACFPRRLQSLVFDEVDAGIGGQAGFAVGRSLSDLGDRHQVLVVTHLPQVAAFADAHLAVHKQQGDDATVSDIRLLDQEDRVIELARMLSGQPDSDTARQHAQELMVEAAANRRRDD